MAIAMHPQGQSVTTHRPPWMRQRANDNSGRLGLLLMVPLAAVLMGVVLSGQLFAVTIPRSLLSLSHGSSIVRPAEGALPARVESGQPSAERGGAGTEQPVP